MVWEGLARRELESEDLPVDRMTARRFLDVRYLGQSFELTVDYPGNNPSNRRSDERSNRRSNEQGPALRRRIADSFHRAHLQRFGYADRNEPVEVVNLRLKLELQVDKPDPAAEPLARPTRPKPIAAGPRLFLPRANCSQTCTSAASFAAGTGSQGRPWLSRWTQPLWCRPGGWPLWTPFRNLLLEPA